MEKQLEQVLTFHKVFGAHVSEQPTTDVPDSLKECRLRLIREEVDELDEKASADDVIGVADALADILYVVFGTAHTFGLADVLEAVFDEVHASNMSKLDVDGRPIENEAGKFQKGPNYFKPRIADVIGAPQ